MEEVFLPSLKKQVLKALMETAIMAQMRTEPLSGYDLMLLFSEQFGINISPGTIYTTLNNMERDRLIKSKIISRKRIYELTDEGSNALDEILEEMEGLHKFIKNLMIHK